MNLKNKTENSRWLFSSTLNQVKENISGTGRGAKQAISMGVDAALVCIALWGAYSLRLDTAFADFAATWHLFLLMPLGTVLVYSGLGVYRWVIRSSNHLLTKQLIKGSLLSAFLLLAILFLLPPDTKGIPRSLFVIYFVCLAGLTVGIRMLWRNLFMRAAVSSAQPVAIYGAGNEGRDLVAIMQLSGDARPVLFLDDDARLESTTIAGLPVVSTTSHDAASMLANNDVCRIVSAVPLAGSDDKQRLFDTLNRFGLPIQTVPTVSEIIAGTAQQWQLRDIEVGDILGRAVAPPDVELLSECIKNKVILVTGGGGSIGSEICRQILRLKPLKLIVLDQSEENIYRLTEEMGARVGNSGNCAFYPMLGSVTDSLLVEAVISDNNVDCVYHAAAYKHVPIIEGNIAAGFKVNVLGTLNVLEASIKYQVEKFVLISTDKAVRPANAMGATKRLAEMVLQAQAKLEHNTTISMVRFGNVLGSSGSVVPKFTQQIASGGPVTLTDPDVERYFMTTSEAAQLVIQAGGMSTGGEVFVLDMGEPIKILDLAKRMIQLSGLSIKTAENPNGEIEIQFYGLRPGEKLFEELFITENFQKTRISKILVTKEPFKTWPSLFEEISNLGLLTADPETLRDALFGAILVSGMADSDVTESEQSDALFPRKMTTVA